MLENSQPLLLQIFLQLFSLLILLLVFPLYVWYIFCSCSTVLGQSVFFFPLFDSALKAFIEISNWLFSWPCLIYWWAHRRHGHSSFLLGHFNFFLVSCTACVILVPRPEIEPTPHAVEARSPNHWTTREVPEFIFSIRCPVPQVPWWLSGRESTCQFRRHRFDPWVGKIPWRRKWQPILVFLPGKSHGQRSLAGYSLWGCRVGHD